MKKIILILLLFLAYKQALVAQEITSTLTQVTTELLKGDNTNKFNWATIEYSRLNVHQPIKNIFDIMFDDGEGGTTGGSNGGSTVPYAPCNNWGGPQRGPFSTGSATDINPPMQICRFCLDDMKDHCATVQSGYGSSPGTTPNINDPYYWILWAINHPFGNSNSGWGSLPWGNLGGIYSGGFLNPPASPPPPNPHYSNGGGGNSTPPPATTVPPPNQPVDIDDPIGGGAASQQIKDSIIYDTLPCNDSINKAIEKRVTKDLHDIRAANSQADSIYNRVTNGYPSEQSMTGGRDSSGAMQTTAVQDSFKDNMVLILQNISQYNKDITIHSHTEVVYGRPDIFDIYKTLTLIDSGRYRNSVNTGFIFAANGNVFAVTVKDADAVHLFLSQYPPSANLDMNQDDFFSKSSKLYYRYRQFLRLMESNNINKQLGTTYAMAYLLGHPLLKDAVSFYQTNSINNPFHKLNSSLDYSNGLDPIIKIQITKCN